MKRFSRFARILSVAALASAPAFAEDSTKALEAFSEIELTGSVDLDIDFATDAAASALNGAADVLDQVSTTLANGRVVIDTQGSLSPEKPLQMSTSDLKLIRVTSSSDVRVRNFKGAALKIEIMGSGDVTVQGEVDHLEVQVLGSGSVNVKELAAKKAEVKVMGSGETYVQALEDLSIQVLGSGDVHYTGPAKVKKSVLGSGEIVKD